MLSRTNLLCLAGAVLLFLIGAWLRFSTNTSYRTPGFDELLYRENVQSLEAVGPFQYGLVVEHYLEKQRIREVQAELPPTRFLYVFTGWLWKTAEFGSSKPERLNRNPEYAFEMDKWLIALRHISALGSTLLLALSGVAAWRWAGRGAGMSVLALMAFAPLQIHTSQHAMIDGFFSFWAMLCLWLLWENLCQPNRPSWLVPLGLAFTALVLTKENAFFVFMGMLAILAVNPWAKFGQITKGLLLTLFLGGALGLVILVNLCGGLDNFQEVYILLVRKAEVLDYAILTGDGPWYRYLIELLTISPLIFLLAVGGVFGTTRESRPALYLLLFIAGTYLVMCNVRYGMNVRYTTIWDLPLRFLAYGQLVWLIGLLPGRSAVILPIGIAGLCLFDLTQYRVFFLDHKLYELAPDYLLRAIDMIKG